MNDYRRGERLLWLFTALPLVVVAAFFASRWIPARWMNLYFLAAIGGVLATVVTITVRENLRQERRFIPKTAGFSRKLDQLAVRLRDHAAAIETAAKEGEEVPHLPRAIAGFAKELQRLALKQGRRELPSLDGLEEITDPARFRAAARDGERYAREVRARGGIFKLGVMELIYGSALLIAALAWGCWLVWRTWDEPSIVFFGGVFLVVSSVGLMIGLVKSQRDPA